MGNLKFRIELNVLNHLGIGLYSSTPAVLTEIVANAWDADAPQVSIDIETDTDKIVIEDTGHGMSESDVENKFLRVGYSRRTHEANGNMSLSGKRRVMGRKGIGKLAMFSLADQIDITTKKKNDLAVSFRVDVKKLREFLNSKNPDQPDTPAEYPVETIATPTDFTLQQGTRIELTRLNSRITKTEPFLRTRLARRFSIFGSEFKVLINKRELKREDAGFYEDIQFLWHFDEEYKKTISALAPNIKKIDEGSGKIKSCVIALPQINSKPEEEYECSGFIASVDEPKKLVKSGETINKISIFANGRVFQEDILKELGSARYFNSYLVGEVHADFLDSGDNDCSTASREAIRHDDDRYQLVKAHLKECLMKIRDEWDVWRFQLGYGNTSTPIPAVEKWIMSFPDPRDRKLADRVMTSIANASLASNHDEDKEAKKQLYRSTIVGFEKLRVRNNLDKLTNISNVLSPEFQAIFSSLDDIEESHFYDITKQRLEVVKKFVDIVASKDLEKVAQKYLFDHLWLLDTTWDRISGSKEIETTLTGYLKKECPDSKEGARIDIAYRTSSGRHAIIELKRPGLTVNYDAIQKQGRKYLKATKAYYTEHPDLLGSQVVPAIDIYLLLGKRPPNMIPEDEKSLKDYNMSIITYSTLVINAKKSYEEYLQATDALGKIEEVLASI